MKIGQIPRSSVERGLNSKQQVNEINGAFQTFFEKEQKKLHQEALQQLLADIEKQGEKLARQQTVKDLQQYKRLVQRFVQEAVNFGLDLKQSQGWNLQGRMQKLTIVKKIDDLLLELTDALLEKGESSIQLLGRIGEIKGLLINLYT